MDKKKTNKKKLSTLVKQQVPEFVLTDHPKFTEFLTSYFLFMESAELNLEEKNRISHRARAANEMKIKLHSYFSKEII